MLLLLALGCSSTRSGESKEFDARGGAVTTLPVSSGASCEAAYRAYVACYYGLQGVDDEVSDTEIEQVCEGYGPEWDATFACYLAVIERSACETEQDWMEIQDAVADCPVPQEESRDTGVDEDDDDDHDEG